MTLRTASCICGQLVLTVSAEPVHVHACTCTRCQRATGSFGAWNGWFPASAVTVQGEVREYAFGGPQSPGDVALFCPVCGRGGYSRLTHFMPDCVIIAMGSFAQPGAPPVPPPKMVHFWDNRPQWIDHIADLPKGLTD